MKKLLEYKSLIDFTNKDQKNNYKWVESYLHYNGKKNPHENNEWLVQDAIDIHRRCWMN